MKTAMIIIKSLLIGVSAILITLQSVTQLQIYWIAVTAYWILNLISDLIKNDKK